MKKKVIAGAIAIGLIPFVGVADVSAKPLPNQVKTVKPMSWACDSPYLVCKTFAGNNKEIKFNYNGSNQDQIRVFVANDGNKAFNFTLYYPNGNILLSSTKLDAGETIVKTFDVDQTGEYKFYYDNGTGDSNTGFFRVVGL
ncbi:hypothetical protein [Bacillus atrophaeus]|uniref:hypothetical protein n=1 Tax=Bacillus atrophaeus TaxID=1452 RepID=UPI000779DDD6|nr:hypothetical protein [Bacillus atrophaeus]KYD05388.1 hypothetical protein B4144_1996 [Bacillus atrophaeus]